MDIKKSFLSALYSRCELESLSNLSIEDQYMIEIANLLLLRKHQKEKTIVCEREFLTKEDGTHKLRYIIEL